MSSHHFVKEGQEPAVFIIDPISLELIEPLLEWAPLVIVLDSALDRVLLWGIKIDVVLTHKDQVEKIKEKIQEQAPVKIISYEVEDDPVATGFHFLTKNQQRGVTAIVEPDKLSIFSFIHSLSTNLRVVLLNKDLRWSFITVRKYKKWFPAHVKIRIQGTKDNQKFSTQGVTLLNSKWHAVDKDGTVTIQSENNFWIGEDIEPSY